MAKTKISEFDVDPANNTDINSINIAEGCAPSGINNAIRQLMSDLKEFQTGAGGDSLTAVGLYSDTVGEKTSGAGVTVDGVLLKDNAVTASGGFSGALNGAVGGTTPAAGAFTTLSASSTLTVTGAGSIQGLTVGKGAGAVSTNTAIGSSALGANTTGLVNVAVGHNTLQANTTGQEIVAIGQAALYSNTTGSANTAIGRQALQNNTTASNNTAVGYQSQYTGTTATQNTALGVQTLYSVTTATNNVAIGHQTMYYNTTGSSNTGVGLAALQSNTTGGSNTAIGQQALLSNTTASYNTAVGYQSLYTNTTGTGTALGAFALKSNTTGSNNTALGGYDPTSGVYGALQSNTTGSYNVGVGTGALQANTTASNNTAVGYQAGYSNTTGLLNAYLGSQAGYSNTTGSNNVALGGEALYTNSTGSANIAIGRRTLYVNTGDNNAGVGNNALIDNTTGSNNVAFGSAALKSNTTASYNTAVGYQAGYTNSTGTQSTYLGSRAGYNATGNYNTIVGDYAGQSVSTGTANSFLGQGAGNLVTTGGKNTIIGRYDGNQGGLDIRTASNYIVLSDGDGNPRQIINGSGEVGIGTTPLTNVKFTSGTGSTAGAVAVYGYGQAVDSRSFQGGQTNASYAWHVAALQTTRTANSAFSFLICESDAASTFDKEFILRGDGNAYADGTWNNNGADYAEYFESATGQAIPVGSTVVLDGNKVRLATESDSSDIVIGVVRPKEPSKASMVVGNTAWNKWANKYLTDDFDRYIMEDHDVVEWTDENGKFHSYESQQIPQETTIPSNAVRKSHDENGVKFQHYKLNPDWNPDSEYINRENREEWLIIGLIGQVKVLKGQNMGSRWVKMRDVSANVEEWMIR